MAPLRAVRGGRGVLLALLSVGAWTGVLGPPSLAAAQLPSEDDVPSLLVLAPASLGDVITRVAAAWESAGGAPVRTSVAATSRLAPQMVQGGRADVFISADARWMEWARERGAVEEAVVLVHNRLVAVVPSSSSATPDGPLDLAGEGISRLALAGENVPAGRYARAALEAADVWDAVAGRIVRGGSVRGALEWVARGEVDAGIVYATDARAEPGVRVAFTFPEGVGPPVTYSAAVGTDSASPGRAREFVAFLRGPEAAAIFRADGFISPAERAGSVDADPDGGAALPASDVGPDPWRAVRLSLVVGLLAAVLGLVPAVGAGWLLARRSFPGKSLLSTVLLAPLVLPPVVTGFLLLTLLGREGALGAPLAAMGFPVPFTPLAPIVAALVVGFPLYVVAVRGAFEAVDPRFEELSWTLGRPPLRTFFRVALPLALPGVAAGAVLAFGRALGEFGATVVLAGNVEGETRTIPLAVYTLLESPEGGRVTWILVGASVLLSLLALLGYEALSRRQRHRLEDHHGR